MVVGVGVGLVEMTAVSAGVVVSGVATSEPPQAVMPARTKRDRRVRANCRDIALFRPVQGVEGQDDGREGFGAIVDYRKGEVGWSIGVGEVRHKVNGEGVGVGGVKDGSPHARGHGRGEWALHWASLSSSPSSDSTPSTRTRGLEPSRSTTYTCISGCSQSSKKPSVRIAILDPSGDQAANM